MKDIQVRDIKNYLTTHQPIRFDFVDTGESFIARIGSFYAYADMYVTEIKCRNNELVLTLKREI